MESPEVTDCAGTTTPLPSAAVSVRMAAALPAVTVSVPEFEESEPRTTCIWADPMSFPVKTALAPPPARSPETTPPVTLTRDQESAVTLAMKLSETSRVMA